MPIALSYTAAHRFPRGGPVHRATRRSRAAALAATTALLFASSLSLAPAVAAQAVPPTHRSHGPSGARDAHARGTKPRADSTAVPKSPQLVGDGEVVPLLRGLGNWRRRVETRSPIAQRYFDQGLRLYYAFNHAEAVRAFEEAQRLDPSCAMCAWGEAMALGPNINAPMDSAAEWRAVAATKRAVALVHRSQVDDEERRWVHALAARYLDETNPTRSGRDSAFAVAMARIADGAPNDPDALALAAEAAMTLSPWAYWTKDGRARPWTPRLLGWLERGLRIARDHPGLCHFYIHAVEAAHPERAVACAERLAALMPGAGHIVHMPAHIYIRLGRWADAIESNRHAVHADDSYFEGPHTSESAFYGAAYRAHNHHFLTLAAVMAGASSIALQSANDVVQFVTPELARAVPAVEPMLATPVQTLVTFGRWDEVLAAPLPPSDLRVALAHAWYARGVAFAATGRRAEAMATIDSIRSVSVALTPGEPRLTLEIAALAVEGELALRGGEAGHAAHLFGNAVMLEDRLGYMEPPTWYYQMRHSLGKALLADGRPREAEQAYRADLARFPENGWSLKGLALALAAQGKQGEADKVSHRLSRAWRMADVRIDASRY